MFRIVLVFCFVWVRIGLADASQWRPNTAVYSYRVSSNGSSPAKEIESIIGQPRRHRVKEGETLLDIARLFHLGYQELVNINPGVDPWVPLVGSEVQIPSVWILPDPDRRGLVLNIPEMRLYYYLPNSQVMTFPLGIGVEGSDTPAGKYWIGEKRTDPTWYVPVSIQKEMEVPRKVVPPGPDNPLGRYWMRLSSSSYGIHGTNNPWAVGRRVTHGCIRLYPEDIAFLFPRVRPKTPVQVVYQYTKVGSRNGLVYFQVFRHHGKKDTELLLELIPKLRRRGLDVDWRQLREILRHAVDGTLAPVPVNEAREDSRGS